MLFLEDHIRAVQPALAARRDDCDAMLCCMSANEVTRLTRLGRFDMAQEATGALAMLKKLRGGKPGAGQQRRRLGRRGADADAAPAAQADEVHPRHRAGRADLLPGAAVLAGRLGREPRQPGAHAGRPLLPPAPQRSAAAPVAAPPIDYPDVGLYHPRLPGRISRAPGATCPCRGQRRHGRAAAAALLPDLRQRRALRRRDRGDGSAGPARHPGLRQRPRLAPGDRSAISCATASLPSTPSYR